MSELSLTNTTPRIYGMKGDVGTTDKEPLLWCVLVDGVYDASFLKRWLAEWWCSSMRDQTKNIQIVPMYSHPPEAQPPVLVGEKQPDIVERLRASVTQARALDRSELLAEAAREISILRKANAVINAQPRQSSSPEPMLVAQIEALRMENKLLRDTIEAPQKSATMGSLSMNALSIGPAAPQEVNSEAMLLSLGTPETPSHIR